MPVTLRRSSAALAMTALVAVGLGVGAIAVDLPRASAVDGETVGAIRVVGVPADQGILVAERDLSVRITVTNGGTEPLTGARAELRFDPAVVNDEQTVRSWLTDTTVPDAITAEGASDASVSLVDVAPGATAVATLTLPADDIDLEDLAGVRLLSVTVQAGTNVVAIDRTAVVGRTAALAIGVSAITAVVPLIAPEALGRLISAEELSELTAPGGSLDRRLDTGIGRGVVFALDPRIIASVRLLGNAAPASAVEFLTRLEESPNDSFSLRWGDADPLATVGVLDEPLPSLLGAGTATLLESAPAADGSSASPSPDAPAADRQALQDVISWPHTLDDWVWPASGTLGPAEAAALADAGVTTAVLPASDVSGGSGLVREVGEGMRAVVADDLASHAVSAALSSPSRQLRAASAVELGALLAVAPTGPVSPPMLVLIDRDATVSPQGLGELLDQIVALPWVRAGGLAGATVPGAASTTGGLSTPETDAARDDLIAELVSIEESDAQFARIAVQPELLREDRRLDLLTALSIGGENLATATGRYREASEQLQAGVQVVESNTITLLTDRTSLPVTVQNSLPVPVRVFVRVDAATAQLRVEDQRVETTVGAGAQARALVPVQSLVNGDVDITVSVLADDGEVIGSPVRVDLNLQAGWETAGTIAIGAAIALLFGVGLVRDIRKRRARRASPEIDSPADETSAP